MGRLWIPNLFNSRFKNRKEAAKLLVNEISHLKFASPVVLGIQGGGILVASEIVRELGGELDVALASRIGSPQDDQYPLGSVSENGNTFLNKDIVRRYGIGNAQLQSEKNRQQNELVRKSGWMRAHYPKIPLGGKTVILCDEAVTSGATVMAAIRDIKQEDPEYILGAFPVCAQEVVCMLSQEVDEFVCLQAPHRFYSVSEFYHQYNQPSDKEVLDILEEHSKLTVKSNIA